MEETVKTAELGREIGCPMLSLWNGQDGYDYPLQADYSDAAKWLTDGLGECCARIPDQKISLEYKPKEPRNHCFLPNVWAALTLIAESGAKNMGVTIDVGHSLEAYENVSEAACAAMSRGRLFHFHMNDNWRLWDDDMIAGSVHTIEFIELFYWLRKLGYTGYISTDQLSLPRKQPRRRGADRKMEQTFEKITEKIDPLQMQEILDRMTPSPPTSFCAV